MLFSSPLFVFLFLPVVLTLYFVLPRRAKNLWLLAASLVFYAWGEKLMVAIMLASITANYLFGMWVERARRSGSARHVIVWGTVFNIGLLVAFKYADWLWSIVSFVFVSLHFVDSPLHPLGSWVPAGSPWREVLLTPAGGIRLPIGISFFTFQAFSYVLDVYRRDTAVQRNPFDFALYVALFPQLIAGPIVRYKDVAAQIIERSTTERGFASGVRRFVIGLGKKMLVANIVAKAADGIFDIPADQLTTPVAWLGILCYTLQIYFDFSAYSDMAIGLGRMFGFEFLENFAHPYVSRSITEFWRRWHISLSTWFRDYLYIPLGGSRLGTSRTYLNLVVVFFLCGLWHGASFSFVAWGLYHGLFLVLERAGLVRFLEVGGAFERVCARATGQALARFLRGVVTHGYVVFVVMIGWVFFRASDLGAAGHYLSTLFGLRSGAPLIHHVDQWLDPLLACALIAGVIGSTDWVPRVVAWYERGSDEPAASGVTRVWRASLLVAAHVALACVFLGSAFELAAGSYNPFIYFRF
jgi:alginate O-acetyltransferase complex protein AlgI